MWACVWWGVRFAGLINGDNAELVPFAFAEAWDAGLQLFNGGHAVVVVGDEGVEPASKLVFLLNDIVADGAASIILGFAPSEGHWLVIKVHDLRLTRGSRGP